MDRSFAKAAIAPQEFKIDRGFSRLWKILVALPSVFAFPVLLLAMSEIEQDWNYNVVEVDSDLSLAPGMGVIEDLALVGGGVVSARGEGGIETYNLVFDYVSRSGSLNTAGHAYGVYAVGSLLYVADGPAGLAIMEVSSLRNPILLGTCDTPGEARAVTVAGNYCYVADGTSGLQVIDVTDPGAPMIVGSVAAPGSANDVASSGTRVFVASGSAGLVEIDVATPNSPRVTGELTTGGAANRVEVAGNRAYVVDEVEGLKTVAIGQAGAPLLAGTVLDAGVKDVVVSGSLAYVSTRNTGFRIFDVSDMVRPRARNHWWTSSGSASTSRLCMADGQVLISSGMKLSLLDVGNPANPQILSSNPFKVSGDLCSFGDILFVVEIAASGEGDDVVVINAADFNQPIRMTRISGHGGIYQVSITDNILYVSSTSGVRLYDVSNPASPVRLSTYNPSSSVHRVSISGKYACMAALFTGLDVVDVSDPTQPQRVGFLPLPSMVWSVAAVGDYVFVSTTDSSGPYSGRLVDIRKPESPVIVKGLNWFQAEFAVAENRLYVLRATGLEALDVTDPVSPRPLGGATVGRAIQGPWTILSVGNGFAYTLSTSDGSGHIRAVDTREVWKFKVVGGHNLARPMAVAVTNRGVAVTDVTEGLVFLDPFRPIQLNAEKAKNAARIQVNGPRGVPLKVQRSEQLLRWQEWESAIPLEQSAVLDDSNGGQHTFYRAVFDKQN